MLLTWPLAAEFGTAVPGGGDAWQHIWNLWWMRKALADLHTNPFYTNYLYYPHGVTLLFHTLVPLEGALTVPFQLAGVDLVPLYNGLLALSFVLAGYATWLLVRDLTGCDGAAFVAGAAFAFCPYHLGHLLGHLNLASLQWIPFYLWTLFRACGAPGSALSVSHRSIWWAVVAGIFLAANAFTELIYVAFLGVFTAGYLLWRLLAETRGRDGLRAWGPTAVRLAVMGAVFGALAGPLLYIIAVAEQGQTWMTLPPRETLVYSSDLVDSFVPSALHTFWSAPAKALEKAYPQRDTAERSVFLGYTTLLVGAAGLAAFRRRRGVWFWAAAAVVAWLLSLGPVMHVLGHSSFSVFGSTIPMPYLALYSLVPGFSVMRVPARFVVLASLALAVLVGYALSGWSDWLSARQVKDEAKPRRPPVRPLVYALVTALIALDSLSVPYPMAAVGYHIQFYERIAKQPGDFALLELPLRPMSDYMSYQTVHGHPIVYGYLSRQPPDSFVGGTPVLHWLLNTTPVSALSAGDAAAGATALHGAGIRYVVVHWWAFTDAEAAAMRAKLAAMFPGQTPEDDPADRMAIYTTR